jgi:hypothetical protein
LGRYTALRAPYADVILHKLDFNLQCNYSLIMDDFDFQWDAEKAIANSNKHGISFEEAKTVFSDTVLRLIPDPDSSH